MAFWDLPPVFGPSGKKPSKRKKKSQTRKRSKKEPTKRAKKATTPKAKKAKKTTPKRGKARSCKRPKTKTVKKSKKGFTTPPGTPGSYPPSLPKGLVRPSRIPPGIPLYCVDPADLVPYEGPMSSGYAARALSETGSPVSYRDPRPKIVSVEPFEHEGRLWVHVGTLSIGKAPYVLWAKAHELLPLKSWKGPVYEHYLDLPRAGRTMLERGYEGLLVKYKNKKHVLGPEAIFVPLNHPECL